MSAPEFWKVQFWESLENEFSASSVGWLMGKEMCLERNILEPEQCPATDS